MKTPIFFFAGLIAVCLMAVTSLKAQTTWQAVATDASWGNAANWTAGIPTNTTQAIFDASNITTTAHNGDRNVLGITFTGGNNFTIDSGGGVIYSWGNGITVNGGNQTFNAAQLRPRVTSSILNNGAGLLDFNQVMLFHLTTDPGAATITFGGSGNIDLLRYERRTSGMNISIVKSGTGTLTIQGAQTTAATAGAQGSIDGPMTINGGVVSINAEANLGANPAAFNAGGLTLNGGSLQGTASFSIDDVNRGVTLGASGGGFDVTGANTLTVANPITGAGSLTKSGTGTLVLSGANNYTGTTTVNAGILRATATGAIPTNVTVASGGTFDGNALNWSSAGRSFTISGTGATGTVGALTSTTAGETSFGPVTLAGNATIGTNLAKNNYFSTITGGGNTLTIAGTNETNFRPGHSLVNLPSIVVSTTGSGRLRFEGASTPAAATTITISSGGLSDTYGALTMGPNLGLNLNGGTLEANGGGGATTATWNGPVVVSANSTVNTPTSRRIDWFGNVSGTGTITKTGADMLNIRGGISSLGGLQVNAGRLRFESDISPGSAVTASVNSGAILDSFITTPTRTMGSNLTLNLNGGTLEANGGGEHSWNGPVTVSANSNVVANNRIDFFGNVSGTGTITKTGGQVLNFRGGVTSLGGLNINAGRVRYEGTGFSTWAGPITVNTGGILSGWGNQNLTAAVDLNGGTLAVENNGTGTFASTVTAQANSTIDTAGGNITLNGTLTGTANLGKNGDGILLISGSSTGFTGTLTVTNGSLRAANTNALPVNVAINSGASFDANGVNFGARNITIAGPGETGFVGAYTNTSGTEGWVRNITLSANATIGSSAAKINSDGAINGGGFTLTVAGASETNFRGGTTFSNLAGITVSTTGSGRLRLEGDITPASLQTITVQPAGRLDTWASRTLGANLAVNLNGGIMESQGSGVATTTTYLGPVAISAASTINTTNGGGGNRHITLAGSLSGSGTMAKTGPADLQLTGDNTAYSGNINVNQGRLFVNNTAGSGTGTGVVTVASGARLGGTGTIGTLAASGDGVVVQSGGTFAPGNSPGVITIFGTLTLQPGANFEAEIRTPGTDLAIVSSTVTLSGANLIGTWGGNANNLFRGTYGAEILNWIIQNDSASAISGFFANSQPAPGFASLFGGVTPQLASLGGQTFAMFYDAQYTAGPFAPANLTGGNDLLLIAVPEPSRAIFAILALGLLCHRRRRA